MSETTHGNDTAPQSRFIANGVKAHQFTPEDRVKGARRSAEVRREKAMSHAQRVRARVEKQEKAMVDALVEKAKEGNVQALQTLWAYAYGTPAKVEPEQLDVNMTSDAPRGINLADVLDLARKTGVDVAEGSNHG